ncbi:MAG: transcriptional regulator, partial [Thermoprotei archaeon]
GNLGSHLRKLEEAGYVRTRKVLTRIRSLTLVVLLEEGEIALHRHLGLLREALGRLSSGRDET